MKKTYIQPKARVIDVELEGIIANSLTSGDDVTPGQNVSGDAPARRSIWDYTMD